MAKKKSQSENTNPTRLGEFGSAIMQIAEEKGIPKEKVIETIEAALAAAYKKDYGKKGQNIRAEFDEKTGSAKFFLVKEVVDETTREFIEEKTEELKDEETKELKNGETKKQKGGKTKKLKNGGTKEQSAKGGSASGGKKVKTGAEESEEKDEPAFAKATAGEPARSASLSDAGGEEKKLPRYNPERDFTLEEAKKLKKGAKVGDIIETELESKSDYGRVAAQTAKQVIIQRIREAERDAMYKEYKEKEGEVISGIVQRVEGRNVFVDLGKSVGVLFPSEQIRSENYRIGQRIKVYLMKVESDPKGPGITLSRTHPEMVRKLFKLEVPEIFSGTVEIKATAREAGSRTKIAVASNEKGVDPIGSCVGQKGTRVQAVIDEIGGEKIDIIEWNEDQEKFIGAALSPAKVLAVELNEENRVAVVKVPEDQLSLAIGRQGQNVRLAAKLTGWRIDMVGESQTNVEESRTDADATKTNTDLTQTNAEEVKGEKEEEKKEKTEKEKKNTKEENKKQ